jgi:NAD(P)-dependent dehydrogenase (short-subunit alcohol dehydrogenase family)
MSTDTVQHASDRVVVVTGAAGGIGAALVARFIANGDTVVATDLSAEALDKLRTEIGADGLHTVTADISDADDVQQVATAVAALGGVDVLVNCAGWFPFGSFADTAVDLWRRVIDINVNGMFLVTQTLLPQMRERGWGRIINFGSGSVYPGVAGQVHYVTAKAGVIGFTRSLARELGPLGITVNQITPGVTLTGPVLEQFPPELLESQRRGRAIPRDEYPDDLVGPVLFLASPDADFISGQTLNVDGGMYMV